MSKPEVIKEAGRTFFLQGNGVKSELLPSVTKLESCSLDGLLLYAQRFFPFATANVDAAFIHVESPTCVKLYGPKQANGAHTLDYVATAKVNHFPFGNKLSQEEMIIKLRCCFSENDDLARLIAGISAITSGPVTTSSDDGISQTVTVKSGVSLKAEAPVGAIRELSAFRSFPGIESPVSKFLFRVHQNKENGTVQFSLHDMEGDSWMSSLVRLLQTHIINMTAAKIDVY
jgi:hypothetical protein